MRTPVSDPTGLSLTGHPVWQMISRRLVIERICAGALAVLSAALLVIAIGYGLFKGTQPGPGLFPTIVAALLLVLSLLWLVTGPGKTMQEESRFEGLVVDQTDDEEASKSDNPEGGKEDRDAPSGRLGGGVVAFTVAWSLVPILLLDRIGFFFTTIPYVAGMLIVIARLRWWLVLPITIAGSFAVTIGADAIGLSLPDPYRLFAHLGI